MTQPQYDDETLQQINENADLLAYASQTLEMEQRGPHYFTHCPLHVDQTPSLCFTPEKHMYHCFSCGKTGGIIKFLMDFEGLKFNEAVDKAAKLADIDLTKMCMSPTIKFLRKFKSLFVKAEEYEHEILSSSEYEKYDIEPITEWLDEGISQEMIDLFGVRVDNRQNKIVYPVYDLGGNLINIKARTRYKNYKALKIPKYINYFKVGVMDYFQCLNITLPNVLEQKEIIIFESIKSVMKAYQWGYKNCASAEKHTLTDEQVSLLVRLKIDVVFAYDSDVDYKQPDVWKSIAKLKRITNVFIVRDPDGLLGGAEAKNAPVDCGQDVWEELYERKKKVI